MHVVLGVLCNASFNIPLLYRQYPAYRKAIAIFSKTAISGFIDQTKKLVNKYLSGQNIHECFLSH